VSFDDVSPAALRRAGGIKWGSYPSDVLPAFVADMDFAVAPVVREALARQLEDSAYRYPREREGRGGALAETFALRMRERYGWRADASRALVLADVVQGLFAGVLAYAEPRQGVLVQSPVYPPFFAAVRETGRQLVDSPLRMSGGRYMIDSEHLEQAVDEHTRLLMLCNPQNPTGRVFDRFELEAVAEVVLRHDLIVLADEIHADLVFDGRQHVPFASLSPEVAARTVTFTSASKAFNIAGLCCAVAHFGSESLRQRFLQVPPHLRGPASNPGIAATVAAWSSRGTAWLGELLPYLAHGRDLVTRWAREHVPAAPYGPPEGTYLAWLDLGLPQAGRYLLEHARVALSGGPAFGASHSFVRLNFATSHSVLEEILRRMAAALKRRAW
jgi:cysteine-S-conjugate beta-lyase